MQKQTTDYFQPEDCLSEEQILNYLNGKMSPYEQHKAEMHMLDCELCSDALEGIQLLKNPDELKSINSELKENINNYLEEEEEPRIKVMFPWRIAAAFALIFVSAATLWIMLPKNNSEKIFTEEYKPYPAPQNTSPLTQNPASATTLIAEKSLDNKEQLVDQDQIVKQKVADNVVNEEHKGVANFEQEDVSVLSKPQATVTKEESVARENAVADEIAETFIESKVTAAPAAAASTVSANQVDQSKDKQQIESKKKATLSKRSNEYSAREESEKTDLFEQAMSLYKNEKFSVAAGLFDQVKDKPDALFYSGVSYLSSDQPHLAIKRLQDYRKTTSTTYTEASWWYESLANVKIDHKNDAKEALRNVMKFKGEYFEKAEELLRKL